MTSLAELTVVSKESWIMLVMKPMATTCAEMFSGMPSSEQASGMSNNDPPATPEAPQAEMVENRQRTKAVPKPTSRPKLCAAAKAKMVRVTAEAFILSVAPKGMDTA